MTAHNAKEVLTPERIAWFAEYYKQNPSWGVFHVCLDDGNYKTGAVSLERDGGFAGYPPDVQEAVRWFEKLSPSQRKRLGHRAADLANTIVRASTRTTLAG